jgi:hypothetical protein
MLTIETSCSVDCSTVFYSMSKDTLLISYKYLILHQYESRNVEFFSSEDGARGKNKDDAMLPYGKQLTNDLLHLKIYEIL